MRTTEVTNQTAVTNMLSTQRGSISGVSVDEEMTNLMTYQRAYEASAQLVTTINTLMGDTLAMKTFMKFYARSHQCLH